MDTGLIFEAQLLGFRVVISVRPIDRVVTILRIGTKTYFDRSIITALFSR